MKKRRTSAEVEKSYQHARKLTEGGVSIAAACAKAGITDSIYYKHMNKDAAAPKATVIRDNITDQDTLMRMILKINERLDGVHREAQKLMKEREPLQKKLAALLA